MPDVISYTHQPPNLWSLYGKALRAGGSGESAPVIPPLQAELLGVTSDTHRLERYAAVCGFRGGSRMPLTWPHILAFPLHLRLLTDPSFPLPLLGLVHLRNRIEQVRPIACGERLDIRVHLDNQVATDKGIEFDLVTEASSAGRRIWRETSTNLYRQARGGNEAAGTKPKPPAPESYPNHATITAGASLGRRYGRLSGDLNPIHMHALSARLFGFPRAIAHGMWSKAHCLALLERQHGWQDGPVTVTASFKKPLFLPGKAQLNWDEKKDHWAYQLLNEKGDAPHLTGEIVWG
ncbi:MaoC/PaaZ C-terminal domain-containing protein [Marinobacter sp. JSM 1782161]|uniref:MaoC/PaaZ C-terminal domain-containing protein n=1 Tax=Marinobacter sp. JSM 1782161 TaxID=2685906 RepID=UPI001403C082|nr:MaoC/PaaZ C-terminal domain-containing protein [Marinobacter sp. JSM 1782161]